MNTDSAITNAIASRVLRRSPLVLRSLASTMTLIQVSQRWMRANLARGT
jgi:hypothetical protein